MTSQEQQLDDREDLGVMTNSSDETVAAQEKQEGRNSSVRSGYEFPEGGLRAWSVAIGNAGVMFCTLGSVNSWAVYQVYYKDNQLRNYSPSAISWIGSLQPCFLFLASLAGGPLFDRYGGKVIPPAALIYLFSIFMTSLCKEYWQFMLTQGVLGGLANGFTMSPSMAATPQYFREKRGAAMGIAIAGSSIGGVTIPIALNQLFNHTNLGFGWSVRVVGFLILGILLPSCVPIKARLPPRRSKFLLPAAFKEPSYATLVVSLFFLFLSMFPLLFYIPTYALTKGMSPTMSFYLQSILNAASFPGRILPSILSDKVGCLNVLCAAGVTSGILAFCWHRVESNPGIIVFSAMYGFCSGAIITGVSVALASCPKDPKNIGTYMGMGIAVGSIAALIGPPISGALIDNYDGFTQVSVFCGATSLFGGLLTLAAKMAAGHTLLSKA